MAELLTLSEAQSVKCPECSETMETIEERVLGDDVKLFYCPTDGLYFTYLFVSPSKIKLEAARDHSCRDTPEEKPIELSTGDEVLFTVCDSCGFYSADNPNGLQPGE